MCLSLLSISNQIRKDHNIWSGMEDLNGPKDRSLEDLKHEYIGVDRESYNILSYLRASTWISYRPDPTLVQPILACPISAPFPNEVWTVSPKTFIEFKSDSYFGAGLALKVMRHSLCALHDSTSRPLQPSSCAAILREVTIG